MLVWMRKRLTICQATLTLKLVEVAGFFDFAENDTEIWLLVQFWTTVGLQRTSKFECAPAQCLR
jgi:hypothetical protein